MRKSLMQACLHRLKGKICWPFNSRASKCARVEIYKCKPCSSRKWATHPMAGSAMWTHSSRSRHATFPGG
eukprot:1138766-Pelagomonas_calceolata.AAC.5